MPDVAVADITAKSAVENFIFFCFYFSANNNIIMLQYCRVIGSSVAYQTMPPGWSNGLFFRCIAQRKVQLLLPTAETTEHFSLKERAAWSLKKDLPIFNWEPIQ